MEGVEKPLGRYMRIGETSNGKDTMTGHWEMMGIYIRETVPDFYGYRISKRTDRGAGEADGRVSSETRVPAVRRLSTNWQRKKSIQGDDRLYVCRLRTADLWK